MMGGEWGWGRRDVPTRGVGIAVTGALTSYHIGAVARLALADSPGLAGPYAAAKPSRQLG